VEELKVSDAHFKDEAGKTLADMLRKVSAENKSFML
jgi:hypothetical protein